MLEATEVGGVLVGVWEGSKCWWLRFLLMEVRCACLGVDSVDAMGPSRVGVGIDVDGGETRHVGTMELFS